MRKRSPHAVLCVFAWGGVAVMLVVEAYMAYVWPYHGLSMKKDMLLALPPLAVWLAAAIWFTIQARKGGKREK